MEKKISLKEIYQLARQMPYWDFENFVASRLFDKPETEDTSSLADKLFLFGVVGRSEQLFCDCEEWHGWNLSGNCAECDKPKNFR